MQLLQQAVRLHQTATSPPPPVTFSNARMRCRHRSLRLWCPVTLVRNAVPAVPCERRAKLALDALRVPADQSRARISRSTVVNKPSQYNNTTRGQVVPRIFAGFSYYGLVQSFVRVVFGGGGWFEVVFGGFAGGFVVVLRGRRNIYSFMS